MFHHYQSTRLNFVVVDFEKSSSLNQINNATKKKIISYCNYHHRLKTRQLLEKNSVNTSKQVNYFPFSNLRPFFWHIYFISSHFQINFHINWRIIFFVSFGLIITNGHHLSNRTPWYQSYYHIKDRINFFDVNRWLPQTHTHTKKWINFSQQQQMTIIIIIHILNNAIAQSINWQCPIILCDDVIHYCYN